MDADRLRQGLGEGLAGLRQAREAEFAPDNTAPVALPPIWQVERKPPTAPALAKVSLSEARARLHAAAGVDSSENLTSGYGQYLDDNQWEELGSLFAAQGERDSAGGGFIRTPARIASFSRKRYGAYNPKRTFANMHMLTQPVVHVSEDGPEGTNPRAAGPDGNRLHRSKAPPPGRGAMFVTGIYEDDIVFEDGLVEDQARRYRPPDLRALQHGLEADSRRLHQAHVAPADHGRG